MLFLLVVFLYLLSITIIHVKFFNENLINYFTDEKAIEVVPETETFINQQSNNSSMMNGMTEFMKKDVEQEMTEDVSEDCISNELESYLDEINVTPSEPYDFKPVPTSDEVNPNEENLLQNIQGSNINSSLPTIQAYDDFSSNFSTF